MKKSMRVLVALVAVLLVLVGVYFLMGGKLIEKFTGAEKTKVIYYYLPGCGWCQKFMPEWDKFVELAKAAGIETEKVNAQENAEEVTKKGINAFPTVHVVKGGKATEYDGERTAEEILKFAKSA